MRRTETLVEKAMRLLQALATVNETLEKVNRLLGRREADEAAILGLLLDAGLRLMPPGTSGEFILVSGHRLRIAASTQPEQVGRELDLTAGVSGWVIEHRTPALVRDLHDPDDHPAVARYVRFFEGQRSEVTAPVEAGGRAIGVLNYENPEVAAFTETHVAILTSLAVGAGAAVYVGERQRQLLQMSGVLARSLGRPGDVYEALVRTVCDLTGATRAQVLAHRFGGLTIIASTNEEDLRSPEVDPERSVCGVVARTGQLVNVPDVDALEREGRFERRLGGDIRSEIAVPVVVDGTVTHILNVESPEREGFRRADEETLLALADYARVVVRLEKTFANAFHQMARPVANICRHLDDLRAAPGLERDPVAVVRRNADYLRNALQLIRPRPVNRLPTSLAAALEPVLAVSGEGALAALHADRAAIRRLPAVASDRAILAEILKNLVDNALDELEVAAPPQPSVVVEATHGPGGLVGLAVRDNGRGIPAERLAKIFEPLFTTKPAGKGSGLGLSFVRENLERMGGRVEVESTPGAGTTFRVLLAPVAAVALLLGPVGTAPSVVVSGPGATAATAALVESGTPARALATLDPTALAGVDIVLAILDERGPDALLGELRGALLALGRTSAPLHDLPALPTDAPRWAALLRTLAGPAPRGELRLDE